VKVRSSAFPIAAGMRDNYPDSGKETLGERCRSRNRRCGTAGSHMEKSFIIHHGLIDLHSPYYDYLLWRSALVARREPRPRITPRFYVKRSALRQIVLKLAAKPVFPYAPDEVIDQDSLCWQLSDFMSLSSDFAQSHTTLEADGIDGDHLIVVPFAVERCVSGAGTIFRDFLTEAMIEALVTASEQYPELKAQAVARKLAWRQARSTVALPNNILGQMTAA
jgi:hypothetical protein